MTKDFSKHQKIIDQFRGEVLKADFETKFAAESEHIPKTERFLLKMELKRLAAPCTRLIDLRGHVEGECRSFEHEERTHFLDELAIQVFEENINYYNGYTFGVYEAVMNTENNFRVIYQKEKTKANATKSIKTEAPKVFGKTQYPAKLFTFGPYYNRSEERMNYAVSLHIRFEDNRELECTSSDISVKGCKFRVNDEIITIGSLLEIRFIGLENEFQLGEHNTLTYKVKNQQQLEKTQLLGCERVFEGDSNHDGFSKLLQRFIQGNKLRYKINLSNTIEALQSRSFEQFILPKSNELAVFIDNSDDSFVPRYALTCPNNQAVFQYWQDETRHSTLFNLITTERVERLIKAKASGQGIVVYSFIHKSQGRYFFYTADEQELSVDKDFMSQFLGFAASKKMFAVTHLNLLDVDEKMAYSPLTLSNTSSTKAQEFNSPVPDDVKDTLASLPYIVVASDLTSPELIEQYQQFSFDNIETSKLKSFGHKRLRTPLLMDEVGINYKNQRQELRFNYKTSVVVEMKGIKVSGKSQDFSTSGLKVALDKPTALQKRDVVYIAFPELQKITSSFELKALPYEIMRVNKNKTVINLRVYVEKHQHIGRKFFKALINKNREKLTTDEYAQMSSELGKALRNIYSSSSSIPALIVQTSGSRYKVEAIGSSGDHGRLLSCFKLLSDRTPFYNLYPLLGHTSVTNVINQAFKKMLAGDLPITETVYIAVNSELELIDYAVTTKLASELPTPILKKMFVSKALRDGRFFSLQLKLSRTDEPDMDYLTPELSYVSSYAIHRSKQIEQEIWSVVGVIQLFDITRETLICHKLQMEQARS